MFVVGMDPTMSEYVYRTTDKANAVLESAGENIINYCTLSSTGGTASQTAITLSINIFSG